LRLYKSKKGAILACEKWIKTVFYRWMRPALAWTGGWQAIREYQETMMETTPSNAWTPPSAAHERFADWWGSWEGTTLTWFEPEQPPEESHWRGTFTPLLEGRFVQYEYTGAAAGQPLHGSWIIGYNLARRQMEAAWIDSFHMDTGLMFLTGAADEPVVSVQGSYAVGEGQPDWGWRTVFEHTGEALVITAYNLSPDGQVYKAIETRYQRIKEESTGAAR
jgi:hypothetical protein